MRDYSGVIRFNHRGVEIPYKAVFHIGNNGNGHADVYVLHSQARLRGSFCKDLSDFLLFNLNMFNIQLNGNTMRKKKNGARNGVGSSSLYFGIPHICVMISKGCISFLFSSTTGTASPS